MANLNYPNQSKLEALAKKNPGAVPTGYPARMSDCADSVYGGRGGDYDELQYLRNQNTDTVAVNAKDSDAWNKFATGKGVVGSRPDQEEREFFFTKSF